MTCSTGIPLTLRPAGENAPSSPGPQSPSAGYTASASGGHWGADSFQQGFGPVNGTGGGGGVGGGGGGGYLAGCSSPVAAASTSAHFPHGCRVSIAEPGTPAGGPPAPHRAAGGSPSSFPSFPPSPFPSFPPSSFPSFFPGDTPPSRGAAAGGGHVLWPAAWGSPAYRGEGAARGPPAPAGSPGPGAEPPEWAGLGPGRGEAWGPCG